jgi:hypothetical protein
MSIRVMSAVWDNGPEDQGELLVLLALADYADDNGYCWPAMPSVAAKARMSERNARRIVRKLEASGLLLVEENRGRNATNRYRVIAPVAKPDTVSGFEKTGHLRHENRTFEARKPDICDTKPDTAMSDEPSITIKEPSKNRHDDFEEFWSTVPKKVGKGAARSAYLKAMKKADAATILTAMTAYAAERNGKDSQFTVHPATWLNQERWTDERPESPQDFHTQIDAMLRGNPDELRGTDAIDNRPRQPLLGGLEATRTPDERNRHDAPALDGGGYQQAAASLIKPRRIGGGLL